jgi:2-iminobutanoate/2-iminopropanoate deaminase
MSGKRTAPASKDNTPPAQSSQTTANKTKGKPARRRVLTDNAPRPGGPYSQAIISGGTVYVAGQGPTNPKTGKIDVVTFEEQAIQAFENVKAILEAAGSSMSKVLRVNVYLADLEDFAKMNEVYRRYFTGDFPARTTIGAQLLLKMLIEVDCIAAI